jgi:uncharacterized protein YqjF (DUF2071 family)
MSKSAMAASFASGCALSVPSVMSEVSHRPWPLPETPWLMFMRWHDLLFLHWPVRPELIRPLIPKEIGLDTFDGWCWIGIVPFRMSGVRPRYFPLSFAFPELNVRTYVKTPARSGVWFFSLDATNWLAVRAARWLGLPYYDAQITVELKGDAVDYRSARIHGDTAAAQFDGSYKPTGSVYRALPGELDHWLTERYCLYAAKESKRVVYGEIHHPQWQLQSAETELRTNTMADQIGMVLSNAKPICHFARLQEVVGWPVVPFDAK